MASRPKTKFVTSREREFFLQEFYDNIEENEEQFLGHAFVGDEDSDSEFVQSSDSEVQTDDNNKERSYTADDTENFDVDNNVTGEQEELARKQKFKNLDEVLDESNYIDLKFLMKAIILIYRRKQTIAFLTQMQGKLWQ